MVTSKKKRLWIAGAAAVAVAVVTFGFIRQQPSLRLSPYFKDEKPGRFYSILVDLNGDGFSERISKETLRDGTSTLYFHDGVANEYQHNFEVPWGDFHLPFIIGDQDGDGLKEVYGTQYQNDSLFVSGVEYPNKVILNTRFVKTGFSDIQGTYISGHVVQFGNSAEGQLALSVMGGRRAQPRNLCLYDFATGSWTYSPDSIQSYFTDLTTMDVTGDGMKEIIAWGRAPDNNHGPEFFSDQNSYLMVFNQQLELLDWVKSRGLTSAIYLTQINGEHYVVKNERSPEANTVVHRYDSIDKLTDITLEEPHKHFPLPFEFRGVNYVLLGDYGKWYLQELGPGFAFGRKYPLLKNFGLVGNYWNQEPTNLLIFRNHVTEEFFLSDQVGGPPVSIGQWTGSPTISYGIYRDRPTLLISTPDQSIFYEVSVPWYRKFQWLLVLSSTVPGFLAVYYFPLRRGERSHAPDRDFIRINTRTGFELIPKSQIVYCKADGKYTQVETADNGTIVSSTNLGALEPQIISKDITRVGRSLLINKTFLRKVERKKNGQDAPHALFKVGENADKELPLTKNEVKLLSDLLS